MGKGEFLPGFGWLAWPIWWRRAAALKYFLLVNVLLLAPSASFDPVDDFLLNQDKLAHILLFLLLAFLVRWALPAPGGAGAVPSRAGVLAALLAYAIAIEALQPLLGGAGRQFDWLDMAGNVAGVCCGWLLYGRLAGYHAAGISSA